VLVGYSELGYQLALPGEPPVGDWSAKSQDALGVVGWAKSHGGAELNVVRRRLVLTGGSQTVVVVGLKGRVVGHHQALPVVVDLSKFGALSNVSAASIDLDAADPIAVKLPDEEAGSLSTSGAPKSEPFFARQTLSLASNEPATVDVWMQSSSCDCDFELVLQLVVDGAQREQIVHDADNRPFRIGVGHEDSATSFYELGSCDASDSANALVSLADGAAPRKCLPLG
jgi:hypothetical protein